MANKKKALMVDLARCRAEGDDWGVTKDAQSEAQMSVGDIVCLVEDESTPQEPCILFGRI